MINNMQICPKPLERLPSIPEEPESFDPDADGSIETKSTRSSSGGDSGWDSDRLDSILRDIQALKRGSSARYSGGEGGDDPRKPSTWDRLVSAGTTVALGAAAGSYLASGLGARSKSDIRYIASMVSGIAFMAYMRS